MIASLMAQAVALDREVRMAVEELDRVKRTQTSTAFERIGPSGRNSLDGLRRTHTENVEARKKRFSDTLKTLAKFHEVPRTTFLLDSTRIADEAKSYTSEAKDWITTIRSRLLAYTRAEPMPEPPTDPQAHANGAASPRTGTKRPRLSSPDAEQDPSPSRSSLAARINDIEARIDQLRDRPLEQFSEIRDKLDATIETRLASLALTTTTTTTTTRLKSVVAAVRSSGSPEDGECTPPTLPTSAPRVTELSHKVGEVGSEVSELEKTTAEVRTQLHQTDEELTRIRAENEEFKQYRSSVRLPFFCVFLSLSLSDVNLFI